MAVMNSNQQSAYNILADVLRSYNLENLSGFLQTFIMENETINEATFIVQLREQPAYKQRFAANEARRKAGLTVLSESEYLSLERSYAQLMRASGLPTGFYDSPDDFQRFIENDLSISELNERVQNGYQAVKMANPQVVKQMQELYGVSESQLAAYFLDPSKAAPVLTRQAQAAQIAAQGRLMANMGISAQQAEELAQAGIGEEEARSGFAALQQAQGLFQNTLQEQQSGEQFTQSEQIGAVFGTNAAAQQRIRQRARRRQSEFETGGGFAAGEQGEIAGIQ